MHDNRAHFIEDPLCARASLVAKLVTNLPAMQETLIRFLGWEDLLQKEWATHSNFLRLPC